MNAIRLALLLTLSFLGLTALSDNTHHHGDAHNEHAATASPATDHNCHHHDGHNDHFAAVAHHDMLEHALQHFGPGIVNEHTYGVLLHWIGDWELRWLDYDYESHTVTLYHATTHDHTHRCTSHLDIESAHVSDWNCAH